MLALWFSQDQEVFLLLKGTKASSSSPDEYAMVLRESIIYLGTLIKFDWNTLKKTWCLNDDKVIQIIQAVVIGMLKEPEKFKMEKLRDEKGRWELENNFKLICQSILKDKDQFFRHNIDPNYKLEEQLLEIKPIKENDIDNLLRIQNKISIKQFGMDLRDQQMKGKSFFKQLFEHREIVQSIKKLKYLLNWANFIYKKYNAQITIEEAKEYTMKEIIERENSFNKGNPDYIQKVERDYSKFETAWNSFASLIITEDNVEATIPIISRDSKMIYCCLTSTSDHDGFMFYLLLKYIASEQNKLIDSAEDMIKRDNEFGLSQSS